MTINLADNTPRVSYALAQGATQQVFTVSFEFFDDADLNVYIDGTLKTLTTDYLTADNNDVNDRQAHTSGTTGFIHFTSVITGATGGSTILITRSIDIERTTDFPTSGAFQIATLNTELDRTTAILADLNDKNVRSVKLADTDTTATLTIPDADTRPNKYLGFDGSGNLTALSGTGAEIGTIETGNLADALITTAKLADSSVTSAKIVDGTIATADIADDAITAAKVADNAVATASIADDAVTNAKMADDSVGANELIDNSVGAGAINIVGNGSSGQAIVSDADGSFSYKTLANQGAQSTTGTTVGTSFTERTSVNITPTSTSSKILIMASYYGGSTDTFGGIEIQRDSTVLTGSLRVARFGEIRGDGTNISGHENVTTNWLDEPNTTSQVTYKLMSDVTPDNANIIAIEISS